MYDSMGNVFVRNDNIKTVTIQNNIKSIPSNAFYNCINIFKYDVSNKKISLR